jgi:phosphoribosylamine--glycine ligase
MNVLVVGSGAREHAIAWKLRQSPRVDDLFIAPGNAGTTRVGVNLPVKATDREGIVRAARDHRVDLVVVGPEDPLAAGLVDYLTVQGVACFGPTQAAAEIEASKAYAQDLIARFGIPTAAGRTFSDPSEARSYVRSLGGPLVVKASGLAAGKGVTVAETTEEAVAAVERCMLDREFGDAGYQVVIQERLTGRETSAHAFTDGQTVVHLPFSCDHKRALDGDRGPNTGGMGAYSPPHWLGDSTAEQIRKQITEKAVRAMFEEGHPFRGLLYPGVMITDEGPKVYEFNCRFGDPEAQVLLPRLKGDLFEVLWAVAMNRLHEVELDWSPDACVGVVVASGGYPGRYETGHVVEGLGAVDPDVQVFHAGTRLTDDGRVVTAGGRVLTVVSTAPTMDEARDRVYQNIDRIRFDAMHYRKDIGLMAAEPLPF